MGKALGKSGSLKLDQQGTQSSSSDASGSYSLDSSGSVVTAAATADGGSFSGKIYQHWADGDSLPEGWQGNILQDNKSNYFEGEVIPHVFVYTASNNTPLVNGQTYTFTITYNYYQGNTNAGGFAYMTDYDADRDPSLHDGLSGIEPTADGTFTGDTAGDGVGMEGSFYTVDADVISVTESTPTPTAGTTTDHSVTVTFVYTGPTTSSGFAEFYYGLYVAQPGDVQTTSGDATGASEWTGGSLQTTVDINGSGATSLQLSPDAIIRGEISGMKFSDINGDGSRDADGADNIAGNGDDEVGLSGWTIFLDTNNNGVLDAGEESTVTGSDGSYSFVVTPDADQNDGQDDNDPYLVREVQQAGWTQTTTNPAPITITAADPTETDVNFGNQQALPTIHLEKDATFVDVNGDNVLNAGDKITYTFTVTNTGNVTLTDVNVTDDAFDLGGNILSSPLLFGTLAAGASSAQSVDYVLTQDDVDALANGSDGIADDLIIDNTATAHGTGNGTTVTDSDDASVTPPLGALEMTIEKTATIVASANDEDGIIDSASDDIHYSITVTNTGSVTLTNVIVVDPRSTNPDDVVGTVAELAPGQSATFTFDYDVQQSEIDANGTDANMVADGDGDIDNTAAAVADGVPAVFDSADVPLVQNPALNITKDASVPGGTADAAGEQISYTITVANTGNVTLTGVAVTDPYADAGSIVRGADVVGDGDNDLEVGETWGYTATHTVTQAEIDSNGDGDGQLENTATADSNETGPDTDDAAVPVAQTPAMNIVKEADVASVDAAGDVITYTYTVTNTGNVALSNVVVTDDNYTAAFPDDDFNPTFTGGDTDGDGMLDLGETWTYTAQHVVTQAEMDAGVTLHNVAVVTADDTPPDDDDEDVPVDQNPGVNLTKAVDGVENPDGSADSDGLVDEAGDVINYRIEVANTGNVTLTGVVVMDTVEAYTPVQLTLDSGDADGDGNLDVGETWVYLTRYTATQDDLDNNGGGDACIDNVAVVSTDQAPDDQDDACVDLGLNPSINIDKITIAGGQSGDGLTGIQQGSAVTWQYTVINTGNVTLENVTVTDDAGTAGNLADDFQATYQSGDTDGDGKLDLDEAWVFTAQGTAKVGNYANLGTVDATFQGSAVSDTDPSSYQGVGDFGLIAPTGTDCHAYISGTAQSFDDYYAYQGGVAQYSVKNGLISQTNPGVFFYYTGLSGAISGTDANNDGNVDPLTVTVIQSDDSDIVGNFGVVRNNVKLFAIQDLNDNGVIDAGDECVQVKLKPNQIQIGDFNGDGSGGDVQVNFTPLDEGAMYVLSVKYETNNLVGTDLQGTTPDVHYDFVTLVGGTFAETDSGGLNLELKA